MKRISLRLGAMLLAAALAACTVGPDYRRPATPQPPAWTGTAGHGEYVQGDSASLAHWWTGFRDAELNHLVAVALTDNLDIRTAGLRIAQARAQRKAAAASWLPTFGGSARGQRYRVPNSLRDLPQQLAGGSAAPAGGTAQAGGAGGLQLPSYLSVYQAGFDASWELDLFGGTRRRVEAAEDVTQAAVAQRRGAVVATLAELGSDYAELRGTQAQLALTRQIVQNNRELLALTRNQAGSGLASDLDVARAQSELDTSRAALPLLQAQQLRAVHAIAILLGRTPESMEDELLRTQPLPPVPPQIPVALPATVLRHRPDVQQAERQLAAATAEIGVAVAARLPTLALTGSTGLASNQLDELLRHDNWTWNAAASLTAPIFQGGRLQANQQEAEARARQAALRYRQTVLQALQETEDALQGYAAESQQREALQSAVGAAQTAFAQARSLYRSGLGSYLDVLDADRALAQARSRLVQNGRDRMRQLIALYQALGGGWEAASAPRSAGGDPAAAPAADTETDTGGDTATGS
jgi:NodT family efflux transporter outer membrane factor (OMF) lipoprotein